MLTSALCCLNWFKGEHNRHNLTQRRPSPGGTGRTADLFALPPSPACVATYKGNRKKEGHVRRGRRPGQVRVSVHDETDGAEIGAVYSAGLGRGGVGGNKPRSLACKRILFYSTTPPHSREKSQHITQKDESEGYRHGHSKFEGYVAMYKRKNARKAKAKATAAAVVYSSNNTGTRADRTRLTSWCAASSPGTAGSCSPRAVQPSCSSL